MSSDFPVRDGSNRWFNLLAGSLATLVIGGAVLVSETYPAWAQHVMIARTSDDAGGATSGHMFVMPAMPARFGMLTRPEFTRRDVPLLKDTLDLDESQMYVTEVLFESYQEQFREALDAFKSVQKRYRVRFPGMEDSDFPQGLDLLPPPEVLGMGEDFEFEGDGSFVTFDFGEFEFAGEAPGNISIGVTRSVNVDSNVNVNDDGSGAPPEVSVAFVATDENGENLLTPEQQQEIVERISAQVRERLEQAQAKIAEAEARRAELEEKKAKGEPAPVEENVEIATAEEVAKAARTLLTERNRLRDELLADVANMLSDEQRGRMPKFVRDHRRINTLRYGEFAGESVDLARILNQQHPKLADAGAYTAAKSLYETELEGALKARNEQLLEHEIDMIVAMDTMISEGSSDDTAYLKLMDEMALARVAVRDVNERSAAAISSTLEEASRKEFDYEVREESFPMLYQPTLAHRTLDAAHKLESIDDETRHAIDGLAADFETQIAQLNDRIAAQMRADEPKEHRRMAAMMKKIHEMELNLADGPMNLPEFEESPHEELMSERRTLGKRTLDQLRSMLSEEQLAQLPKQRRPQLFHFDGPGEARVIEGDSGGVQMRTIESEPAPPPTPVPPSAPGD